MTAQLLGRLAELGTLRHALARTFETGHGAIVLVSGEPGIGKSALLKSFIESVPTIAADRPVLVGYGQAMTNSLGSDAFQAIRECLRSLVAGAERSSSRETLERVVRAIRFHAPDWLESVPLVGSLLAAGMKTGRTALHPVESSDQLNSPLDQLTTLVRDLFSSGPVVLVLDDLHWADAATIDIVMALALKLDGPLMLVLAYRAADLRADPGGQPHPLNRAVNRLHRYRPDSVEVDLRPLSAADTRTLILDVDTDQAISEDEIQLLVSASDGVPLFAESLALMHGRGDTTAGQNGPPRQIAAVLEERLSFATVADQRLLEAAVVVGFTFEVEFVAGLLRVDLDELYDRLDGLLRVHQLITPAGSIGTLDRYALKHPLMAEVLRRRAMVNVARWRRYHARLVDILLGQPISDELAVRAAAAAVVAQDGRAAPLSLDAARRQYRAGAITKARQLAEVAVTAPQAAAGESFEAAELLARCLSAEANHRAAAAVCARALSLVEPGVIGESRVWQLTLLQVRSLRMTNDWAAAGGLLAALEAGLPPEATEVKAEILMLRAEFALCGPDQDTAECIVLCDRVAATTQDVERASRAHGHRGLACLAAYEPAAAERWLRAAIDVARADRHPYAGYEAVHWLSKKKIACLELQEAWQLLEQLARTSETSGVASDSPFHRRDASRVLGLAGDTDRAGTAFVQFFDLVADHERDRALTVLTCQIAEMDDLHGPATSRRMLDVIAGSNDQRGAVTSHHAALAESLRQLRRRPAGWHPVRFAVDVLGVDQSEAVAAEAIFRFDVPDLARLRASLRPQP